MLELEVEVRRRGMRGVKGYKSCGRLGRCRPRRMFEVGQLRDERMISLGCCNEGAIVRHCCSTDRNKLRTGCS